jgi:hypothetical protein
MTRELETQLLEQKWGLEGRLKRAAELRELINRLKKSYGALDHASNGLCIASDGTIILKGDIRLTLKVSYGAILDILRRLAETQIKEAQTEYDKL